MRVRRILVSVPVAPGFYRDPGGAGIREWTGTEWSPFLRASPVRRGPGAGPDPAPIWSPLAPDVQQAQWDLAIKAPAQAIVGIVVCLVGALMMALCGVLVDSADPDPQDPALVPILIGLFAVCGVLSLGLIPVLIRQRPALKRIAEAAGEARWRARVRDKHAPPPEPM